MPRFFTCSWVLFWPWKRTSPLSGCSRPAIIRSRVVFPQPDGPSSATSSPSGTLRLMLSRAVKLPNCLLIRTNSILMANSSGRRLGGGLALLGLLPFQQALNDQGDNGRHGEKRCRGKGRYELVLVEEHLHLQGQGVGHAADVAGHHRHGAEFTHGAGITENHPVQ